ncbi:DUF262 domain-containing protein [Ornithinibacillus massiliensis]|uniref:DUF262 domain-containing protein n=1 Tax=Ornithinibacillus massiliensis TaxID=1944633 RepID=A0ABS5M8V2_9BACI|nr:DUF262 domain-containing protein [Ornithinibacillus massiliensis]MBS3678749.1 DUF262 domain-containing protein [Ornithinibacillus massiliensis]
MTTSLLAKEYPIDKIFSNDYAFSIPNVQRPYSWTEENTEVLLDDLLEFIDNSSTNNINEMNPYFLGSVVLIKEDGPDSQVLDGQQRLTTLTILLAVLKHLLPEKANEIKGFLYEEGNSLRGTPDRFRLTLRDRDAEFFREYIQADGGIDKLSSEVKVENDSQQQIVKNTLLLIKRLSNISQEERTQLATFIIMKCYLVVVSTPDFDSAYRIFSVLNDRGLDLSHSDILKAEIIGKLPKKEQDKYNDMWENAEEYLGRETFNELFSHIRMIYRKYKLRSTIIKEFRDYVKPSEKPKEFIESKLVPFSNALKYILEMNYKSANFAEEINNQFFWLLKVDNSDWVPAAILYLSRNENEPKKLLNFFTNLERLAMGMMILRYNINQRIERYRNLLIEIEDDKNLFIYESSLQLTIEEKRLIVKQLDGDLYQMKKVRVPVLLKLDSLLSDGQASYNYERITVEHVLSQNPQEKSQWTVWFPNQETRDDYVHKIGNLVLLSRQKNSQAKNYEFDKKKEKYFSSKKGVSSFVLTSQVLNEKEWTEDTLKQRQDKLLSKLIEHWRLSHES